MKLDRIHIKNFRSIKDATIHLDHSCKILIGKNEAGKSNVLKAIAAVFGEHVVSIKDRRKKIDNETIDEYRIRAFMQLDTKDIDEVLIRLKKNVGNTDVIEFAGGKSLREYISRNFGELIIVLDIDNNKIPHYRHRFVLMKPVKQLFIKDGQLTHENAEAFNLENQIFNITKEIYEEKPISCNYWRYNEDFLLPSTVSISQFINDTSSQKALENLFILCNRENIQQEFSSAMAEDGDYSNLLDQVSHSTTRVFHTIWKDFKQTSLALLPNGNDEILIKVVNKTKYSFEDRSDGFKKFISILLMLSTQSRSNRFDDHNIILIDEPDQSLYPTSARYLRDELLKIAEKAIVIYTTHSQYMIDSKCIDRHLIVEKIDDVTSLSEQDSNAPFSNDELLRNAIGTSIFESIQPVNIIFEGWLDKQLFDKYCEFCKEKSFDSYGKVYLRGISGLEALIQLLILANKKFLIIADSDKTSKDKRKDFEKNYPEYKKNWLSYGDVAPTVSTMEDFLTPAYITARITAYGINDFVFEESKDAIQNIENAVLKDKDKKQEIKNDLMDNLTKTKIDSEYAKFIEEVKNRLSNL